MNKIRLSVLGLSYSDTQSGAYALVLSEEDGERRIPIIIGAFEAQAIAIELEGLKPPRPLTHDLFLQFASTFHVDLAEINIYKLEEGIFYANLVFDDGKDRYVIDSRTSDAVALALRFKCPIFTSMEILDKAGIIINQEGQVEPAQTEEEETKPVKEKTGKAASQFSRYDLDELEEMLQKAVTEEEYERATLIRDEINRRKKD